MKIVLLFPPAGNLSQPYTSLPTLTAFMRRAGHTVIQRDLALETFEALVNGDRLRLSAQRVAARLASLVAQPELSSREKSEAYQLGRVNTFAAYIVDHIDEAKRALRDPEQAPLHHRMRWAFQVVERGMELISAEYWPWVWNAANFATPDYEYNMPQVLTATAEERRHTFYDFFEQSVIPSILAEKPDLVGISCTYFGQILATLALAQMLKQARPDLPVVLGGAVIAHLAPVLEREPRVFSVVDGIVVGEGEHALLGLAEALSGDRDLSRVPNLMYFDGGQVRRTGLHVEDVNLLPTPDYAGLPLEAYLTPEITVLLPTDRGCYWHRCAFCVISTGMHHRYRPRAIPLVIEDMQKLHRQVRTRCFFLSNDAIPPARMKALAEVIRAEGLPFLWQTETRLEKAMTPETCRVLVDGGCRRLMVGIESGSQRMLDLVDKGTQAAELPQLMRNCDEAGIAVHTFLMVGLPTETRAEAQETLAFVEANRDVISSLNFQMFSLYPDSKIYASPERYGVTGWKDLDPQSLDLHVCDLQIAAGMSQAEISQEAMPEAYRHFARLFPIASWTTKGVLACRHPALEDFERSYLVWLAHYGVRHYRQVPGMLEQARQPLDCGDVLDLTLRFPDGLWRQNGNGLALTLFSPHTARVISLPPEADEALALYDGQSTVRQVAERFARGAPEGRGYLARYYQALGLGKRLLEGGFLTVCAES